MKLAKAVAIVVCAGLLSAGGIGSARHAYAQDAPSTDSDAWSAGGTGSANLESADQSSPETQATPLNIGGCWSGGVKDDHDGTGTAVLNFLQNGSSLKNGSHLSFEWPDTSFVHGWIHGQVSSTGIKFKGQAGKGCPFSGAGTGDASAITGALTFKGKCAQFFKNATFSISPGC